jgi:predicted transcriptional regulator
MADGKLIELTELVVSSYIAGNKVSPDELPGLIKTVYDTFSDGAVVPEAVVDAPSVKATTAQIRKTLADPNVIVSLIDGKGYKTLKRHINAHDMTVDQYKAKFGLPMDYPTTSRAYSVVRSKMAVDIGLGRKVTKKPVKKAKTS